MTALLVAAVAMVVAVCAVALIRARKSHKRRANASRASEKGKRRTKSAPTGESTDLADQTAAPDSDARSPDAIFVSETSATDLPATAVDTAHIHNALAATPGACRPEGSGSDAKESELLPDVTGADGNAPSPASNQVRAEEPDDSPEFPDKQTEVRPGSECSSSTPPAESTSASEAQAPVRVEVVPIPPAVLDPPRPRGLRGDDNECDDGLENLHAPFTAALPPTVPEPAVSPPTTGDFAGSEPVATEDSAPDGIAEASSIDDMGPAAVQAGDENPQAGRAVQRSPRQYRPAPRDARRPRGETKAASEQRDADRALPLYLRVVFERAGFCRVSLLARRNAALPADVVVAGTGTPGALAALDEDWYQDAALESGELLSTGVEWSSSEPAARWSLGGREIFVLAARDELSGFVSTARLVIGDDHLVLCTEDRLADVQAAIAATGSAAPLALESDSGIPPGWAGLLHVAPKYPVAPLGNGDIVDVLRPLAEAEIALDGGIRLARGCWLAGHPPQIRLRGDVAAAGTVQVDGQEAAPDAAGTYCAPGWNARGEHWVACASGTRTYRIENGKDEWDSWTAYTWSSGGVSESDEKRPSICGGRVLPPRALSCTREMLHLPVSNPVLVGARPGDVYVCEQRTDIRARELAAFPPFDPVWALPANAIHCNKRVARIMPLTALAPALAPEIGGQPRPTHALRSWCLAILDAGRKGLALDTSDASSLALWHAYKRAARAIWRNIK